MQSAVTLCRVMAANNVNNWSLAHRQRSAGDPGRLPYVESMPMGKPTNPYGQSKLMVELILRLVPSR